MFDCCNEDPNRTTTSMLLCGLHWWCVLRTTNISRSLINRLPRTDYQLVKNIQMKVNKNVKYVTEYGEP